MRRARRRGAFALESRRGRDLRRRTGNPDAPRGARARCGVPRVRGLCGSDAPHRATAVAPPEAGSARDRAGPVTGRRSARRLHVDGDMTDATRNNRTCRGGVQMKKTLTGRLSAGVATIAAVLVVAVPSQAALTAPVPEGPADGTGVAALPAFSWTPVAGAERYEFQIAADPAFNSPVLGSNFDRFFTRNTSATLVKAIPNGSYWWRVRAVTGAGAVSPWSGGMSIEKSWASAPALLAPAEGDVFSYPTDHFRLEWAAVPGAWKYLVSVATDPGLGSLVWSGARSRPKPRRSPCRSRSSPTRRTTGASRPSIPPATAGRRPPSARSFGPGRHRRSPRSRTWLTPSRSTTTSSAGMLSPARPATRSRSTPRAIGLPARRSAATSTSSRR